MKYRFIFVFIWCFFLLADGKLTEWSKWKACSSSRGQEQISGENWSEGNYLESKQYNTDVRDSVHGQWGQWAAWTACSVGCGEGTRHRYRASSGQIHEGSDHESQACFAQEDCPLHGQWGQWAAWTACSVGCGEGTRHRYRASSGQILKGSDHESQACFAQEDCPLNGKWSGWGEWRESNTPNWESSTQPAYSLLLRSSDWPSPAHNGSTCQGAFLQAGLQPISCKVDGGWSEWAAWTSLKEVARRTRVFNNHLTLNDGRLYTGSQIDFYSREDASYRF